MVFNRNFFTGRKHALRFHHFILFAFLFLGSFMASCQVASVKVHPGAEAVDAYLPQLKGKRVGLVANHTSLIGNAHLLDTLLALSVDVRLVFTPEHGFRGTADAGEVIQGEKKVQQVRVVSLYGNSRKPAVADLSHIDVLVFDLQDVGARFFTYISTLHYVMEACAENNVPLLVLDRPNPHVHYVDGPVLEMKYQSFVGMHPVPVIYGMTIGEYAMMINGQKWLEKGVQCALTIIPCLNYTRSSTYSLPVKPSPNLPTQRSVLLYPSTCFFEGTIMSEGRGTEAPFEIIGHPAYPVHNFSFIPHSIKGASVNPKFKDELCWGFDLRGIPMDSLVVINQLDIALLIDAYKAMDLGADFFTDYFDLLAGTEKLRNDIISGKTKDEIRASWQGRLTEFKAIRKKYLIYE